MPVVVATSTHAPIWMARDKDIKTYLHFDRRMKRSDLEIIANDPAAVASNTFYPLLRFTEEWVKFREPGKKQKKKSRPLRYSSRRDAAIYARYRVLLADLYEKELAKRGVSSAPIAYRKIPIGSSGRNKCNIEFARDVFDKINEIGDCIVTVVDIKSYFESLDHEKILEKWELLLGKKLPADHAAIFRALTKYSYVDLEVLFERLGMYEKGVGVNRSERRMRRLDRLRANGELQICSPAEFRKYVCGADPLYPSLIQRNSKPFGIPQGTPISDLIANFYLLDFDYAVSQFCTSRGGTYYRYSDDIICVVPIDKVSHDMELKEYLQDEIVKHGSKLEIQNRKVSVCAFRRVAKGLQFTHILSEKPKNGLEYLGFEYDGVAVKLKNSTLSNAWRKLKRYAYGFAKRYIRKYRSRGDIWIVNNYPSDWLEKKILKDVSYSQDGGYDEWTFIKYTRRASRAFSDYNRIFSRQTARYRYLTSLVIKRCFNKALSRHGNAAVATWGGRP